MRRLLATTLILGLFVALPVGAFPDKDKKEEKKDKPKDTEKAAATRKALDSKISVDYKDTLVQDVAKDLAEKIKDASKTDVTVKVDSLISGLTRNQKINYTGKDKPVTEILDEMGKKNGLGYIVISGKYGTKYPKDDGTLLITKGEDRGYQPAK
jgi:hypothetical protein